MGHAIGDWDNDGYLDWFSTAIWHNRTDCSVSGCKFDKSGNVLFRNLGGRQFEEATDQVIKTLFWLVTSRIFLENQYLKIPIITEPFSENKPPSRS